MRAAPRRLSWMLVPLLTSCAASAAWGLQVPTRIVSLAPSNTEIVYALGAGADLVADTTSGNYPPAAASLPKVGGYGSVSIERIVSLRPDLVLAGALDEAATVPALRNLGLKVLVVDPHDLAGIYSSIEEIGKSLGRESEARSLVARIKGEVAAVVEKVSGLPRPRVYWELSSDLWTAGPGSFIDQLIRLAGGTNIASGARRPWLQLSDETVIAENPQVIFLAEGGPGIFAHSVASRPGWADLAAVRDHRVVVVKDLDLVSRPGPRVGEALRYIARELHPRAFK